MKNKLLVISILLIIIIIVSYYWLRKQESSIETYYNTTTNVYIHNLNTDGTVNPILDATNRVKTRHIETFKGYNVDIYIGEGIEEINGSKLSQKKGPSFVYCLHTDTSTIEIVGDDDNYIIFEDYSIMTNKLYLFRIKLYLPFMNDTIFF